MFQLNQLSLRNFSIHRKLDLEFKPGVTGILGDNGAGKSAIFRAFDFLLTGSSSPRSKDELININESTGYVWGDFTMYGKQAIFERHLDTSKITLEYDGQKYLKSKDAKELWAKLFSIDGHIIKNIIIAHQKQIPMLFSGDQADREKVFQKIFMVPPTESLRRVIWDSYIHKCAPELAEENIVTLESGITECVTKMNPVRKQIDLLDSAILTPIQVSAIHSKISHLNKCKEDQKNKPILEARMASEKASVSKLQTEVDEIQRQLDQVDIVWLRELNSTHLVAIENKRRRDILVKEVASLKSQLTELNIDCVDIRYKMEQIEKELEKIQFSARTFQIEVESSNSELTKYKSLTGLHSCPTCQQKLDNVHDFVKNMTERKSKADKGFKEEQDKIKTLTTQHDKYKTDVTKCEKLMTSIESKEQQLLTYKEEALDSEGHQVIVGAIAKYEELTKQLHSKINKITYHNGEVALTNSQLSSLTTYVGESSIDDEISLLSQVVSTNEQRNVERTNALSDISRLTAQIEMFQQRIKQSSTNKAWNTKRSNYLGVLQTVYDTLHTSRFPRKLIESYSSVVEDELSVQLNKFNIPYTARISDGFRIQMMNKEMKVLPEVSGGQEMIVGLCLRLALHSLFSHSFPMLLVDEGTTHLNKKNIRKYFDFIKELKSVTKINQIIIIDHNEGLSEVVDNVINIT